MVAILLGILGYFNIGNLFAAFLGVMGLKVSAYLQPLLTKLVNKVTGRDDAASCDEELPMEDSENMDKEVTL